MKKPLQYFVTRWCSDKYAKMSYSYVPVGVSGEAYEVMAREVDGKLFFAGEVRCSVRLWCLAKLLNIKRDVFTEMVPLRPSKKKNWFSGHFFSNQMRQAGLFFFYFQSNIRHMCSTLLKTSLLLFGMLVSSAYASGNDVLQEEVMSTQKHYTCFAW